MFLLLAACAEAPDSKAPAADTTDTTDTTDTADTAPAVAAVDNVQWTLDDDILSIGIVTWDQTAPATSAWVEFQVEGGEWRTSPTLAGTVGPQRALVLGVPYATPVAYRVVNDGVPGDTYEAQTGALPDGLADVTATTPLPDTLEPSLQWLLIGVNTDGDRTWKVIYDRDGRIVWAHQSEGDTSSMQISRDGTEIIWDDDDADVRRMTIDGTVSETVQLTGLHHTFVEVADHALVWGGKEDIRDSVWERAADGTVRRIFDCATFWEDHDASIPCDGNTLYWSEADDTLLFSSDNENTVVHLDRASGDVLAYWGRLSGAWAFDDGTIGWWKNHSPQWTPDGHLLLTSWLGADNHELTAREYALDEAAQTLTEVWTCDPSAGIVADFSGETRRLANGNTLINYGPGATVREYTPDCELAWELAWPAETTLRRMSELEDLYALAP